ncbi:MAG: HAD family hydrolase [Candidatus Magasanikbacteria bacterium]|jgi:hypothetical protein|nr:HAD family hydrolase [Candidatus Magasanikbacteria bacterium]MBT4221191.1 HAD family hydrolase [Candidatus Magasanikbacteria bacterium]MBT4350033.1 HAD family hydrolase [Candidatus Magasanikbacteria bacterium]MBT4541989.1 HAD family hydrolase [Candidatus Magasanikbacteria bacterium]MBT6252744.1 HAD family hydrolase [Candidatus Magasanikbacteria bacterium]
MNSRPHRVIFDFDSTLFDTEKKKAQLYNMAEIHGYTREHAQKIYKDSVIDGDKIVISLASYIMALKSALTRDGKTFLSEEVSTIISQMSRGDGLLPYAKKVLDHFSSLGTEMYLLSLGVESWQQEKMKQSGISSYFSPERVVFTDIIRSGKSGALRSWFGESFTGEDTVFFNDKPDESADLLKDFPELRLFMRREIRDHRYTDEHFDAVVKTFSGRTWCANELLTLLGLFKNVYA